MDNKVILLDWGHFLHRAVHAWFASENKQIKPSFTCMSMIIASLSRIGVDPDDEIIVACDGRESWRKQFDTEYKGDRAEKRALSGINWGEHYKDFDELVKRIDYGTDWHVIKIDHMEADDIIAVATRYFADRTCVIVSPDADFEQLLISKNVRIYSPLKKTYKMISNPYELLAKKIQKEATDNLKSEVVDEQTYETRQMLVDLVTLPDFVESQITDALKALPPKTFDNRRFYEMFFGTVRERFDGIYNSKDRLDYEKEINKPAKKKRKKKAKETTCPSDKSDAESAVI